MDARKPCRCSLGQIQKYQSKISGPLLDRIDLHVEMPTVTYENLTSEEPSENSTEIRKRVTACREIQRERFKSSKTNARMLPREIKEFAAPEKAGKILLEKAMKELNLSARAYYKILKISRTIADLSGSKTVLKQHIAEAIQYRCLDRQWG